MDFERVEQARINREKQMPEDQYEFRRLVICPDFWDIWADIGDDDTGDIGLPIGSGLDWAGKLSIPYDLIVRFDDWKMKFSRAPFDRDMYLLLDWEAFHQEGMSLVIDIKKALGEGITVIYIKAFEDRGRGEKTEFQVTSDGRLQCVDSVEI